MYDGTLADVGEHRLIEELLRPRYSAVSGFGDDCALLPAAPVGHRIVVTTDPCPEPMAAILGYEDFYYHGWLLATINLSDIAAAGAVPLGLVTSLILPNEFPVTDFVRLLDGVDDCCSQAGVTVVGGNLKEGAEMDLQASAVGAVPDPPLSRRGCEPGHLVGVVGGLGLFWAGVLASRGGLSLSDGQREVLLANVLTPRAKVTAGAALRRIGVVSCAMDNSDGLGTTLETLAAASGVGIELDFSSVRFPDPVLRVAEGFDVEPVRLAMGWGDWHLVVCIPADRLSLAEETVSAAGERLTLIGTAVDTPGVRLLADLEYRRLTPPTSQRFTSNSWFTTGIDSYVEILLRGALTSQE